jgi:Skp family chaperone for outer membrane proteins
MRPPLATRTILTRTALTTLALLLTGALAPAQATPPSANDHNLKIGVVRVSYIYRNMQESAQAFQVLKARVGQMEQEGANKRKDLENLDNQLKQLKPGSPQWVSMRNQLDDKKFELDSWGKKMQLELDREKKAALIEQYRHVNEAVQTVAEQQHLDLVVSDYTPEIIGPDFDGIPQERLEQIILSRAVLFAGKKADVTQEVLTVLDANFAKNRQSIGSTPPAPAIPQPTQSPINK